MQVTMLVARICATGCKTSCLEFYFQEMEERKSFSNYKLIKKKKNWREIRSNL